MSLLVAVLALLVQDPAQQLEAREYAGPGGKLMYRLYTPKGATAENRLPLLLFLHGAGERGDDNAAQLKHGVKQMVALQEKYPCYIVAPQCPKGKKWNEVDWHAESHVTPEKPSDSFASLLPLLDTLQKGFKYIEEESFSSNFQGLFSEINLSSEKLGRKYEDRNAKLCVIIGALADGMAQFSTDSDTLGDAYEYLIGQFAAGSGKKAGEFYTPQRVSDILSAIVTLDSQEPKAGKRKRLESVFDFACGSGSLLLNVRQEMKEAGGSIGKIYGMEKNITTYNLARMNMLLHGVKDTEFEIYHGDTLTNDWYWRREPNPAKKPTFDAVVANPPFSYRWDPGETVAEDMRFKNHGVDPRSAADFAFLLPGLP